MAQQFDFSTKQFDPLQALQMYGQSRTQAVRKTALQSFAGGDASGARSMAAQEGDFDLYGKIGSLQEKEQQQVAAQSKALASLAAGLQSVPAEQRQQAFAAIAPRLQAQGFDAEDLGAIKLDDASLSGYTALATDIDKAMAAKYKAAEPYTLAPGAQRMQGGQVLASNAPNDPETIRTLRAAGIDPESAEGRAAILGHVNPSQFMEFGSDATGRQLIQTRGQGVGGGGGAPLNVRNNNPGNIIDSAFARSQPGYQGSDGKFAIFSDANAGQGAQHALLNSYVQRGFDTPLEIASRWAPSGSGEGNNPRAYAGMIASALGIGVNDKVSPQQIPAIAQTISMVEGGTGGTAQAGPRVVASLAPVADQSAVKAAAKEETASRKELVTARKEFAALPEVKNFNTIRGQVRQIRELAKKPNAQNDIAMIFSYMKVLDPTSVVREGEFATAQNATGVPDQIRNMYNKAQNGERLNPEQRKRMTQSAGTIYASQREIYNETAGRYQNYAKQAGLDPRQVAPRAIPTPRDVRSALPTGWKVRRVK